MTEKADFKHATLELATGNIAYLQGGSGPVLVCLHHSWGSPGALEFHQELASEFTVYIPDMPGWGGSDRPLWARTVRDIAILMSHFNNTVSDSPVVLVGLGFGGYVAAEIAAMNAQSVKSLVLVGATGIQPKDAEILDQMMYSHRQYIVESFKDNDSYTQHFGEEPAQEMRELWDHSREMTARVTWKPYMFNRRLPELLKNVSVQSVLVWGDQDKIVPFEVAEQYQNSLSNSRIERVPDCGHVVEIEAPDKLQAIISKHAKLDQS